MRAQFGPWEAPWGLGESGCVGISARTPSAGQWLCWGESGCHRTGVPPGGCSMSADLCVPVTRTRRTRQVPGLTGTVW